MDRIKSIVALRIREFVSVSSDELPNKRVSVKHESVLSNSLQPIFFKVLRRVRLLSLNKGQWSRK